MLRRTFPHVYEGWLVVSSSAFIIVMIGAFFFYGLGTIFNPVKEEFGWSSASTALAFSLRSEVQGIGAPLVGYLVDRIGPQPVLLAGIVLMSGGLLGMSFMQNLWQFYLAMVIIALGISSAGGPVGLVATATWFETRRARAMSFMTVGGGISGLLVPLVAVLVNQIGWRDSLRVMSVSLLILGVAAGLNVRNRPRHHPQPMDGTPLVDGEEPEQAVEWGVPAARAFRSRAFLMISFGQASVMFAVTAIMVHQIPFLEDKGVSSAAAALTITIFTLTSLTGRLGFGFLADQYDKRLILTISVMLAAVGMPLLAFVENVWQAIVVLMIIAPGFGGMVPVRPAVLADYFGTRSFGAVNGMGVLIMTFGSFGGPWLVGYIVDRTGNYDTGWLLCAGVAALAMPLMYFARPPQHLIDEYGPPQNPRGGDAGAAGTGAAA